MPKSLTKWVVTFGSFSLPICSVMQFILFHFIFADFYQLCDNEISIRNLYACVLFPVFFILSHYQPHSIGIFISAYFAFNLVTCKLRTRSELFQNIGRLEHYAYAACDDESLLHFLNRFVALFRGVFPPLTRPTLFGYPFTHSLRWLLWAHT